MAEFDATSVKERALAALIKNSSDPEGKLDIHHFALFIIE
jgi:hypothetical protein